MEKTLDGWLRAIDEEMVCTHLGIADASDSYEVAKEKLNKLIAWHVAVATDPTVNGGYIMVPVEPTDEMCEAAWESEGTDYVGEHLRICRFDLAYKAAIFAAQKPETI